MVIISASQSDRGLWLDDVLRCSEEIDIHCRHLFFLPNHTRIYFSIYILYLIHFFVVLFWGFMSFWNYFILLLWSGIDQISEIVVARLESRTPRSASQKLNLPHFMVWVYYQGNANNIKNVDICNTFIPNMSLKRYLTFEQDRYPESTCRCW